MYHGSHLRSKLLKVTAVVEYVVQVPEGGLGQTLMQQGVLEEGLRGESYKAVFEVEAVHSEGDLPSGWVGRIPYTDREWPGCGVERTVEEVLVMPMDKRMSDECRERLLGLTRVGGGV